MNFHNVKPDEYERLVCRIDDVSITDDFGNLMYIGDLVQIHVMPFDYVVQGPLKFDEESCSFYVDAFFGKHSLNRKDEYHDMNARINVTKTFKKLSGGTNV